MGWLSACVSNTHACMCVEYRSLGATVCFIASNTSFLSSAYSSWYCADVSCRVRTTVLGSRNQLCLNDKVLKLPGQAANFTCRALVQHKQCRW